MSMIKSKSIAKIAVTREPVGIICGTGRGRVVGSIPPTPGGKNCGGIMNRITLSRLEEGLGHEGFECSKCHRRVKYIGGQS